MRKPILSLPFAAALVFGACGGPETTTVTGQLQSGAFALDNAVVIAQTPDGVRYVSHLATDRTFELTMPTGAPYSLTLANSTRSGVYKVLSRINWTTEAGPTRFAEVSGGTLALGAVRKIDWAATATNGGLSTMSKPADASDDGDSDRPKGHHGDNDCQADHVPVCENEVDVSDCVTDGKVDDHGKHGDVGSAAMALGAGTQKVTICHIPPGNLANAHTITVGAPAVAAHLAHGDHLGDCLPTGESAPPVCDPTTPTDPVDPADPTDPTGPTDPSTPSTEPAPTPLSPLHPPQQNPIGSTCQINFDCVEGASCVDSVCAGPVVL